jgi:hypothetical protein
MSLSIFLAQFLGTYLIIVFVLMLARKREMEHGIKSFLSNPGLLIFAGALDLLGGLAILIGHRVWVLEWPLVITLLGLLMCVRGVLRLGFPSVTSALAHAILKKPSAWSWMSLTVLVLSVFLIVNGFSTYVPFKSLTAQSSNDPYDSLNRLPSSDSPESSEKGPYDSFNQLPSSLDQRHSTIPEDQDQ